LEPIAIARKRTVARFVPRRRRDDRSKIPMCEKPRDDETSPTARRAFAILPLAIAALISFAGAPAAKPGDARSSADSGYALAGRIQPPDSLVSTGGAYSATGAAREPWPAGDGYSLAPLPSKQLAFSPEGALCFCGDVIFTDDFEHGNSAAWSDIFP
jgi:hypothetical protein